MERNVKLLHNTKFSEHKIFHKYFLTRKFPKLGYYSLKGNEYSHTISNYTI